MASNDNLATVKKAYECFQRGDIAALMDLIADNCDWQMPGSPQNISFAGSFHGRAEVRQFFDELARQIDVLEFEPRQYVAQGPTVVVLGHEKDRAKATGKTYETDWAHCFEVQNGRITGFRDYQDTATIQAALH